MAIIRFDPIQFATDNALAAEDVNALARNARLIDGLSYRGRRAFTNTSVRYPFEYDQSPTVAWRGTFQFRTGVTTLTVVAKCSAPNGGTHTLEVRCNSTLLLSTAFLVAQSTYNVTISGQGYTDLQFVDVEIRDNWTGADAQPVVVDCYISNMASVMAGYGGVPTFGSISKANLDQLMAAQQWVYDRLNVTDQTAFMGPMLMMGNGYSTSYEALIFDGSVEKANGADRLIILYNYAITHNASEVVRVRLDTGADVATQTWTLGQGGESAFDIDISAFSADSAIRVTIVQTVNALGTDRLIGSWYAIKDIYTARSSYPVPTLPATYNPQQSLTFTALQTALNQIATVTNDAANRIINSAGVFQRQRVFRWRMGVDDKQNITYARLFVARGRRAGDALWVRGKGLTIEYGPITSNYDPDKLEWKAQYSEQIIDGSSVQSKLLYFDQFQGLDAGVEYYITGEQLLYVMEQVR